MSDLFRMEVRELFGRAVVSGDDLAAILLRMLDRIEELEEQQRQQAQEGGNAGI